MAVTQIRLDFCTSPAAVSAHSARVQYPELSLGEGPREVSGRMQGSMPSPSTLAQWEGFLLLGGFVAIVFWKLATQSISLNQLLEGDIRGKDGYETYTSAGRAQSLLITLFAALYYLLQIIHNPKEFPSLPAGLVAALAGSQAVYLGGKAQAMWFGRLRDILK